MRHELNKYTRLGDGRWGDLMLVGDEPCDYYVIFNKPDGQHFVPERTIVFQREPASTRAKWGEWAEPDPDAFLKVFGPGLDSPFWGWGTAHCWATLTSLRPLKTEVMSGIVSSKLDLPGQIQRLAFVCGYLDRMPWYHHYGRRCECLGLRSYRGEVGDKADGLMPYRYSFGAENSVERNYVTEKLFDPILYECCCFYAGAPNVADHVDPRAYVQIDLDDMGAAVEIVERAVADDEWRKRLPHIRRAKQRVLNELNPLALIERTIRECGP